MANFEFSDDFNYTPERNAFGKFAIAALKFLARSFSIALAVYLFIVIFYTSEDQRKMRQEIRFVNTVLGSIKENEALLADGVEVVLEKDDQIYREIFKSQAPRADIFSDLMGKNIPAEIYGLKETNPVAFTKEVAAALGPQVKKVEANLIAVMARLQVEEDVKSFYPLGYPPLANYSYARTGASVGMKNSPYYNIPKSHNGLDMVAPVGETVYATGEGVVSDISKDKKGNGNAVTITHSGGYKTVYAHLADIFVTKGKTVQAGTKIGTVGVTGTTFAPHLHYEVYKYDHVVDPTGTFFRSLDKDTYAKLYIQASQTSKTLD